MQNARHVVVVMNGTAHWAAVHKCPLAEAQAQSLSAARTIARAAAAAKVRYLTLCGEGVELPSYPGGPARPVGSLGPESARALAMPSPVPGWTGRDLLAASEELGITLRLGQSGRRDIARAVQKLAKAVQAGRMDPDQLDETLLRSSLVTAELPDPDLIIYSGCPRGEHHLRDDLIFESAYAEFFFSERAWPDFTAADFLHALSDFASRQRRFGKTAEQITGGDASAARYVAASSSIGS